MDGWSKPYRKQHNFFLTFRARHNFCTDFLMEPPNFSRFISDKSASNASKSPDFESYKDGLLLDTIFTKQMRICCFRLAAFEIPGAAWGALENLNYDDLSREILWIRKKEQLVESGEKVASNDTQAARRLLFCEVLADQIWNLIALRKWF